MDRLNRSDLIYVSWTLIPEEEGIVIAHHAERGGRVGTKQYDLSDGCTWESVPACIRRIIGEADERRGEWTA